MPWRELKPDRIQVAPLVEQELARILSSPQFSNAERLQRFLRYVVEAMLEGDTDHLKESVIGVQVFDRKIGFDPKLDPVVRVTARRLREKLEQFYASDAYPAPVRIHIAKGGYVPEIIHAPLTGSPESDGEPVNPDELPVEPGPAIAAPGAPRRRARTWPWSALAALVAVLVVVLLWRPWVPAARPFSGPVSRFSIDLPSDQLIVPWYGNNLAFSPDGRRLAYIARQNGRLRLFLRELKNATSISIPDSDYASAPFFSPDGQSVAVYRPGEIRRYFLRGGSQRVAEITAGFGLFGAVWDADSGIYLNDAPPGNRNPGSSAIYRLDPRLGMKPQPVGWAPPEQPPGEARLIQQVLPGGDALLFAAHGLNQSIGVISTRDGVAKTLIDQAKGGLYLPTGHLVFWRAGNLMIAPMDLSSMELSGPPSTIVNGVGDSGWQGADTAISQEGTLAYVPRSYVVPDRRLLWVDLKGHETPVPIPPAPLEPLDISHDGKKLLLSRFDPVRQKWSLWSYTLGDGSSERLSVESSTRILGNWSADGAHVFYSSAQEGGRSSDLLTKAADGSGAPERLSDVAGVGQMPQSVSADGKWLFCLRGMQPDTKSDIWAVPLQGRGKPQPLVRTVEFDTNPSLSPDGRWLAYASETAGMPDVYLRPFPGSGPRIRVSEGGGAGPLWDPGGRRIYYRRGLKMMAVPFDPASGTVGTAEPLFSGPYMSPEIWCRLVWLSPDGKRFLLVREEVDASEGHRINVVVNWLSEVSGMFPKKGT